MIFDLIDNNLIQQIDAILPQTQCTRCGYPSCMDYAKALSSNEADINQCPPGGEAGIVKLSHILHKPIKPLNPVNGIIKPRQIAVIDEEICIGCTLCIKACPVDAVLGSNKMMHTIIADECTGCDLCVPVCPVDCISMIDIDNPQWGIDDANHARDRYEQHKYRKERDIKARETRLKERTELLKSTVKQQTVKEDLLSHILTAVKTTPKS